MQCSINCALRRSSALITTVLGVTRGANARTATRGYTHTHVNWLDVLIDDRLIHVVSCHGLRYQNKDNSIRKPVTFLAMEMYRVRQACIVHKRHYHR